MSVVLFFLIIFLFFFFFNDTATTEIYTLSLHDALPIPAGPVTLHAVHHSQEELTILTTFRAHPLGAHQLPDLRPAGARAGRERRDADGRAHRLRVPGRAAARERPVDVRRGRSPVHQPRLSPESSLGHW